MRRRQFITLLGGAAAWPLAVRAQQGDRVRRIGVLMPLYENDPVAKTYVSAFTQALAGLGWTDSRNVRLDIRWATRAGINRMRALAQELVGLRPDIVVTAGIPETVAIQRETRTIPIVFSAVSDPVASGIVPRLDRPGGNVTGSAAYEALLAGKWFELLSEIAPGLKRAAIMFNPDVNIVLTCRRAGLGSSHPVLSVPQRAKIALLQVFSSPLILPCHLVSLSSPQHVAGRDEGQSCRADDRSAMRGHP